MFYFIVVKEVDLFSIALGFNVREKRPVVLFDPSKVQILF